MKATKGRSAPPAKRSETVPGSTNAAKRVKYIHDDHSLLRIYYFSLDDLPSDLREKAKEVLLERARRLLYWIDEKGLSIEAAAAKERMMFFQARSLLWCRQDLQANANRPDLFFDTRLHPILADAMVGLYNAGLSLDAIAAQTRRPPETIRRVLKLAGVKLRPRGRPRRDF